MTFKNSQFCLNVLDPNFAAINGAYGYDPAYNYVGSDVIYQKFGIGLERHFLGADINGAAWKHDRSYSSGKTVAEWDAANDEFREDIIKLITAAGHPFWARIIAWGHFVGVESLPGLADYLWCKKNSN